MSVWIPIGNDTRKIVAGDDVYLSWTVTDCDNVPVNLTGAQAISFVLAKAKTLKTSNLSPLVTKSLSDGITVTNAAQGKFQVKLSAADTVGLSGTYMYQASLTDIDGRKAALAQGPFYVQDAIV